VLPDRVDNRHYHSTSQSANILEISSKTKFYSDYFLPSSIKLWNRLPIDTRNSRSLNIFKERIKTQNSKCPAYYYSGTRLGQILHTRLRMNTCSFEIWWIPQIVHVVKSSLHPIFLYRAKNILIYVMNSCIQSIIRLLLMLNFY
jgi:hypothetical protein